MIPNNRKWYPGLQRTLLSLFTAVFLLPQAIAEQTVVMTGDQWPPYTFGRDGEDATGGIAVDILDEIFKRIDGYNFSFPLISWKRALREVKNGSKDGIAILQKTPEREKYMLYTDRVFTTYNFVWYLKDRFPEGFSWSTQADLKPYRIGLIRGYTYGPELDSAIEEGQLKVTAVPSIDQLFNMLSRNRIDLVLADESAGYVLAQREESEQIIPADKPTSEDIQYLAISRQSPAVALVPKINSILIELRVEGIIDDILHKHGSTHHHRWDDNYGKHE